jgi:hypothetical protein
MINQSILIIFTLVVFAASIGFGYIISPSYSQFNLTDSPDQEAVKS